MTAITPSVNAGSRSFSIVSFLLVLCTRRLKCSSASANRSACGAALAPSCDGAARCIRVRKPRSGGKQPARSFPARERPPPARTATRFIENNARYVEYCGAECVGLYYTCINSYLTPESPAWGRCRPRYSAESRTEFAEDSSLEGRGFELTVPQRSSSNRGPRVLRRSRTSSATFVVTTARLRDREVQAATRWADIKCPRGLVAGSPACSPIAIQFGEELTFERGGAWKRPAHHPANKNRLAAASERGGGKSAPRARGMEWPRAPAVVVAAGSNALAPHGRGKGRDIPRRRTALTPAG